MRLSLTGNTLPGKGGSILFAGAVALAVTLVIVWINRAQPEPAFYISLGWLFTVGGTLWVGNRFLTLRLDRLLPWSRWGNLRFFVHLGLGLIFLLLLVNLTYLVLKLTLTTSPPTQEQMIVMNVYAGFIFIPLFSIYFSLYFLKHWRKSELEVEKSQKENIRTAIPF